MSLVNAVVRRLTRLGGDTEHKLGLDEFGALLVTQQGLPYARLAAAGKLFAVDMHAGTGIAPVVAAPTTSPQWGLFNASPNESLVLVEAAITIKSGTAGLGLGMFVATALGPQTDVSADYTGTIKSCLDGSKKAADFYLTSNPTLIGGTPAWSVLKATELNTIASVDIGSGLVGRPDGMFIARPGRGMVAMEVVGPTGSTALFTVSFIVAMLQLDQY